MLNMNWWTRLCLTGSIVLLVASHTHAGNSMPQRGVSSGRNDIVYLVPAKEPYEALPLGNGQLGVMVRNTDGAVFKGKIDEVKIYNRVLSEKDVKRNYNEVSK